MPCDEALNPRTAGIAIVDYFVILTFLKLSKRWTSSD